MHFNGWDCATKYDEYFWYLEDYIEDKDLNFRMKDALKLAVEFELYPYDWRHFEIELEGRFPQLLED